MTVNVEVFGRQVTVWVQDLKCSLQQNQASFPQMYLNHLEGFSYHCRLITCVME